PSGKPGVLMGFIEGREARVWARRSAEDRRDAVLGSFARYFGAAAASPGQYVERDWMAQEYTRGCYGAPFTPGVWTSYGEGGHARGRVRGARRRGVRRVRAAAGDRAVGRDPGGGAVPRDRVPRGLVGVRVPVHRRARHRDPADQAAGQRAGRGAADPRGGAV